MGKASENGKELSDSAHASGMNEYHSQYDREEWEKLLRTARNCRILHMPIE